MQEESVTLWITSPCFQPLSVSIGQKVASTTPFWSASYVSPCGMLTGEPPSASAILEQKPVARILRPFMSSRVWTGRFEARTPGPWAWR